MSVRRNIIANYLGQGWRAIIALAFVPVYIKYLGIESYGLIGMFALLQTWLALLDMGMKPALGREMARFLGGAHTAQAIRDLLRSVEVVALAVAGIITVSVWALSGWLATTWLTPGTLPTDSVATALSLMGGVGALAFVESIYASSVAGLQRQVWLNVVSSAMATIRAVGAVCVLAWVSPSVGAFFVWQGIVSLVSLVALASVVYAALPQSPQPSRFSTSALSGVWRFAAGMASISLLGVLLTQVDKMLLSHLLTLEFFGYFTLAGMVANGLYAIGGPVVSAFYPRFAELAVSVEPSKAATAYHEGAQLVSVLMGAASIILMMFGHRVLLLWTSDPALTMQVAPLVTVLALGTLLHGLMWIPSHMQLAHGWTALLVRINIGAVVVLVPAILWIAPRFGGIGAAWAWVGINVGTMFFSISLMHRSMLRDEKWPWLVQDVLKPLAGAAIAAWLCSNLMPAHYGKLGEFSVILSSSLCAVVTAGLAASIVRQKVMGFLSIRIQQMSRKFRGLPEKAR